MTFVPLGLRASICSKRGKAMDELLLLFKKVYKRCVFNCALIRDKRLLAAY